MTRIKYLDWKSSLIVPFRSSWSLNFMGFQRTNCSHTSIVSEKLVDIIYSVFVLIPWSAPKMSIDRMIPFWSQPQTLLQVTPTWLPLVSCKSLSITQLETTGQLLSPQRLTKGQMLFHLCTQATYWLLSNRKHKHHPLGTSRMVCFFYYGAGVVFV